MLRLFEEIEMPLVFTLFDMERNGVKVEAAELKDYGDRLAVQIEKLEQEIYEEPGRDLQYQFPETVGGESSLKRWS